MKEKMNYFLNNRRMLFCVIALIIAVALVTAYALILPAVTMMDPDSDIGEAGLLEWSENDTNISVVFNDEAEIPNDANLTVTRLEDNDGSYLESIKNILDEEQDEDVRISAMSLMDVSIVDEEGIEIEPAAPVDVAMTSDIISELGENEKLKIIHFEKNGDISIVNLRMDDVTAEFTTSSFSVYAIVVTDEGGNTVSEETLETLVGSTITIAPSSLQGKAQGDYEWSSDNESVVIIDKDSINNRSVSLEAISVGSTTVKLTYKYGKNNSKLDSSDTIVYTVTVMEKNTGDFSDEDSTAEEGSLESDGLTVTVKENGNAKKLSEFHVVVQEAEGEYTGNDVLKAYHIYLANQNNKEVIDFDDNINLKVTLTYAEKPAWFDEAKDVKHYKDGKKQSINVTAIDKDNISISFIVHGFSDFVISSNGSSSSGGGGNSSNPTAEQGSILVDLPGNTDNAWQIVTGTQYVGNEFENKTESGNIRVQKNIIPTGVENEFYVYLSVDTKSELKVTTSVISSFLDTASFVAVHSNTFQDSKDEGDKINSTTINHSSPMGCVFNSTKQLKKGQIEDLTLKDPNGNTIGTYRVEAESSNGTMYLPLGEWGYNSDGDIVCENGFIAMFNFKKHETSGTITLTPEAYSALIKYITETSSFANDITDLRVSELIDTDRFRIDSVKTDSDSVYDQETGIWTINDNATGTKTTTSKTGEGTSAETTTTWTENAAELLYKVTLKTTDASFDSSSGEYFIGSTPSTATYTYGSSNGSAQFTNVSVKGLQYDLKIRKVDEKDTPIPNVTFTLTGKDGNGLLNTEYNLTETTDSEGYITFSGMAWGTYEISENSPPTGYIKAAPVEKTLCFTTNPTELSDNPGDKGTDKIYGKEEPLKIVNEKIKTTAITIRKVDENGDFIPGAIFKLCKSSGEIVGGQFKISSADGYTINDLESGTYELTEISAPDGYVILNSSIDFIVDAAGTDSIITWNGTKPENVRELTKTVNEGDTIVVQNTAGKELPQTGGTGVLMYTLSGFLCLIIAAGTIYVRRKRGGMHKN